MRFGIIPGIGGERLVGQDILHFSDVMDASDGEDLAACCRGEKILNEDLSSNSDTPKK